MKKILLSIGVVALLSTSLMASEAVETTGAVEVAEPISTAKGSKGAYIGIGFGISSFDDDEWLNDTEDRTGNNFNEDYKSSGYKIYGGYQFNKIIAIEASYTNYGDHSISSGGLEITKLSPTSMSIAANIGSNFGQAEQFRFFGIVGLASLNLNQSGQSLIYDDEKGGAFRFGAGFEYSPVNLNGLGFRVAFEYDLFIFEDDYYNNDDYLQDTSLLYVGAQYKF